MARLTPAFPGWFSSVSLLEVPSSASLTPASRPVVVAVAAAVSIVSRVSLCRSLLDNNVTHTFPPVSR